ncbi:MAG: prepilin peptidase [Candidatus Nomurabacteria bacterium]|jgi:prepilin signal peptidase PulO-like enzyme (type II secretory pathway)|nr:prepilin peptidase [Candidatus Nomurabacteria bacterium]
MVVAIIIFLSLVGAACGSFVGAITWRMKKKMNWVKGRSICEHCKHQLKVLDLVPIFSWLALCGKCRYCRKPIGWLALGLEVGVALSFVVSYLFWPLGEIMVGGNLDLIQFALFAVWLIIVTLMAALFIYDARWRLLPNKLLWPLVGVAIVFAILNNTFVQHLGPINFLIQIGLAMLPVTGVYGVLYLISRGKWIGLGDVRFGLVVGLLVNWLGAVLVLAGANMIGTLVMLPLLIRRELTMNSKIPFGPFLILATFLTFLFLPDLINLVEKYFLY